MEEALIRTDKETLKKVKRMAAEKSLSVSAFIREVAEGAAPPAYSISDQLFAMARQSHKEHRQLVSALMDVLSLIKHLER